MSYEFGIKIFTENFFKQLAQNIEVQKEVLDYFTNILQDWNSKNYSKELTADVRCKIFDEHKNDIIDNQIKVLHEKNIELAKEIGELKSEKGFRLTKSEMKEIEEWDKNHECTLKRDKNGYKYSGAIGGHLTYCFTPTGLGNFVTVKCVCGKEFKLDRNY